MDCCKYLHVLCGLTISCVSLTAQAYTYIAPPGQFKTSFHISALYLQPESDNLKYAVLVSGTQPFHQSWHNQAVDPDFSPAFDVGFDYGFCYSPYGVSVDWVHSDTSDSNSVQASPVFSLSDFQFVGPPYDVGPAVFGIKHAMSTMKSYFDNLTLNAWRLFDYGPHVRGRLFGGVSVLRIDQSIKTTFNDFRGYVDVPGQAYPVLPDPSYYFTTKNTSDYIGAGPDAGVNIQLVADNGLGLVGQIAGALTVGNVSTKDSFTSASRRLAALGITTSQQAITAPNATQFVPGFDGKLGGLFTRQWHDVTVALEAGYRFIYYLNAISIISPDTLVQAGEDAAIPEFSTGTMAINSTTSSTGPFSLSGPYLEFTVSLA